MKKIIFSISFGIILFSCKKEYTTPASKSCLDVVYFDTSYIVPGSGYQQIFSFNSDNKLYKKIDMDGATVISADSFAYSNGNMVKSWYSLSGDISHSYTTSEYDYSGSLLIASRYLLGGSLVGHCVFTNDSLARIISITEYTDDGTYNPTVALKVNLNYDANSNLQTAVNDAGTVVYSYKNYDNKPNPFYKLPFDWSFDIFQSFTKYFSKNNQLSPADNSGEDYSYTYDTKDRPIKILRYSRGTLQDRIQITYKCD